LPSQSFRVKNSIEVGTGVTISSSGNITAGVLTATSFVGNGSQLTNLVANYSSVSGVSSYASLSGISSSVVGGAVSATSLRVTGVSTFEGAINVRNGYNLNIGDNNDLRIYNDGTNSRIEETGSGSLYISGSDINIQQHSTNKNFARFIGGGAAELYYNDSKKFSTSGAGVTVTGTLDLNQLNVSGVSTFAGIATHSTTLFGTEASFTGILTASSFRGDGSQLTGIAATTNVRTNSLVVSGISTLGTVQVSSGIVTASSGIATYYGDVSNTIDNRWILGANGTSDYTFTGIGFTVALNDPTLYLTRGKIYEFVNTMGAHPFRIQSTVNGSTGTQFNRGVTNNDVSNGTLRFEVPMDAPSILYYQCTAHTSMGGIINIIDGLNTVPQNAQTSAYVLVATDGGKHISITTGGVTVPQNIFSIGDTVAIYNNSGSSQTITQGTGVTLRLSGTASTGNRTLDQYGLCTILCVASNTFVISGSGLS
jgi:hypothetical protein